MEFSITRRVGAERNDNFYFLPFTSIFHPILALNEAIMVFFNFLNYFAIFLEFSILRRVRAKRNENFYFPPFSSVFQPILALNEAIMVFFNFFDIFFGISYYASGWSGTER